MIRKQFDELKNSGQLPSPSGIGLQIVSMTQSNSWSIADLVHVLSADPALTSRVIKLANSARAGGVQHISTLEEAAMRVGARAVSNHALAFSLISGNRAGRCEEFDYQRFWSESLARAVSAEHISRQIKCSVPTEAFTCALLATVGELGLASVHPVAYGEILDAIKADPALHNCDLESERFAIDSREVTMAMMKDWGLPEFFYQAIEYKKRVIAEDARLKQNTLDLVSVLRMAQTIARFCAAADEEQLRQWSAMARVRDELELDASQFQELCDEITNRWKEWGAELKLPTSDLCGLTEIERRSEKACFAEQEGLQAGNEIDPDKFRPLRILAVDDEPVSLRVLAGQLKVAGHEVLVAHDGEEALAMTLECNPHIVISDWMMPKMDGLELCKALRRAQAGRSVYFLLLTGRDEEERVVEAFEGGIDDYVAKPFNAKILLARVRAGLRLVNLREAVDREQEAQREKTAELGVMARQLRDAAFTDALTNLPNRRYGMERLQTEWDCWTDTRQELSVVMVDIDKFKAVNDTYGHDVGDAVLQRTADAMRKVVRTGDVVSRIGGEEFLIICPQTGPEGAAECAERLREGVEAQQIDHGDFHGNVTISAGVATVVESVSDSHALIKIADAAVYQAKADGRNRVRIGEPSALKLPRSA